MRININTFCVKKESQDKTVSESSYFLKISIKTANLLIIAICTNYLIFIKFALGLPDWIYLIDVYSNYLSMYLSFGFASKYYDFIFTPCNDLCYSCCAKLCYCCCVGTNFDISVGKPSIQMESVGNKSPMSPTSPTNFKVQSGITLSPPDFVKVESGSATNTQPTINENYIL